MLPLGGSLDYLTFSSLATKQQANQLPRLPSHDSYGHMLAKGQAAGSTLEANCLSIPLSLSSAPPDAGNATEDAGTDAAEPGGAVRQPLKSSGVLSRTSKGILG